MDGPLNLSKLRSLVFSEYELEEYGFPRPGIFEGKAKVDYSNSFYKIATGTSLRECDRCHKKYSIDSNGETTRSQECSYHPYRQQLNSYRCCKGVGNAKPCQKAPYHINSNINVFGLDGFVKTEETESPEEIFAVDCLMVYTTTGMELGAISIVDEDCNLVYEKLVKPDSPVIDYNTDHTSLAEKDFQRTTTSRKDVQNKLKTLFGKQTIMVGHRLNEALLYTKVMHDRIIDTSRVYSHPEGKRFHSSLRTLQQEYFPQMKNKYYLRCRYNADLAMKLVLRLCQ